MKGLETAPSDAWDAECREPSIVIPLVRARAFLPWLLLFRIFSRCFTLVRHYNTGSNTSAVSPCSQGRQVGSNTSNVVHDLKAGRLQYVFPGVRLLVVLSGEPFTNGQARGEGHPWRHPSEIMSVACENTAIILLVALGSKSIRNRFSDMWKPCLDRGRGEGRRKNK